MGNCFTKMEHSFPIDVLLIYVVESTHQSYSLFILASVVLTAAEYAAALIHWVVHRGQCLFSEWFQCMYNQVKCQSSSYYSFQCAIFCICQHWNKSAVVQFIHLSLSTELFGRWKTFWQTFRKNDHFSSSSTFQPTFQTFCEFLTLLSRLSLRIKWPQTLFPHKMWTAR